MKCGGVSLAYNEEGLMRGCIESLKPFVDTHIVAIGNKPYYGPEYAPDKTYQISESLGANVITGNWSLDHMQRNAAIRLLPDYDWIITTDADMWVEKHVMKELLHRLSTTTAKAIVIKQKSYYYDTDHEIVDDDFMPVIAIRPDVRFSHIGNVNVPFEKIDDLYIHHLAWCKPKDVLKKVLTYPHAPEFNGQEWYDRYYMNWTPEMNWIPLPKKEFEIRYNPLPEELKAYL
jgi:hypothetical protein